MNLNYFSKTDRGKQRKGNEDYYAAEKISDNEYLFIVADGMGGHQAGQVASALGTVSFVSRYIQLRGQQLSIPEALKGALQTANDTILQKASEESDKKGMGTTFSAIAIEEMQGCVAHVGDSRIYLVRNNKITRITTDHTFVEKMVEEGRMTQAEARDHPQRNILYMSLGARGNLDAHTGKFFDIHEGDIFILCSDGLSNMISDVEIKDHVLHHGVVEAVERMVDLANANGGTDNITLMVIRIDEQKNAAKTEPIEIIKKKGLLASFFAKFKKEEQ